MPLPRKKPRRKGSPVGFNESKKPCKKCLRRKAQLSSDYCEDCWAAFVDRYTGRTGNVRTERRADYFRQLVRIMLRGVGMPADEVRRLQL